MFNDNDYNNDRAQKVDNNQKLEGYNYIIHLNRGEAITFGPNTELVFFGTDFIWGEQARFALQAPDDVSILRLELFARRFQLYEHEMTVHFGEKISIGPDLQICLLPQPNVAGQVCVGINSKDLKPIKKSTFNYLPKDKKQS